MIIENDLGGDLLFSTLLTYLMLERLFGVTIPCIAYVDHFKVLYAVGNISGSSDNPGTPTPGEAFITVYFRVNNLLGASVEFELLSPCLGRAIDPTLVGAEGIPVSEILNEGELFVVRTGQMIRVNLADLVALQRFNPSSIVASCPVP